MFERRHHHLRDRSWLRLRDFRSRQSLLALRAGSRCGIDVLITLRVAFIFVVQAGRTLEGIEQFLSLQPIEPSDNVDQFLEILVTDFAAF